MVSDLGLPENRPALAWVASIPADWTTPTERLLLVALALDSFDGRSCAPGRDALMTFCGIRHVRTFQRLRDSLTSATLDRPALIAADVVSGRHTRYRFAPDSNSLSGADSNSLSGDPDLSAVPDSNSLSGQRTTPTARPDAVPVSTTCQHDLSAVPDSNSLSHPSLPLPTHREGERKEEALAAPPPDGGALTRPTVAQVRDIITAVTPAVAVHGVDCANTDLADALGQAMAAGWTTESMAAVLADMPAPKKSPTGQAIARLRDLAGKDPQAIILTSAATSTAVRRDPLAEQDQRTVATFCKWSGADRAVLSAALSDFEEQGLIVDATMRAEHPSIWVMHPDIEDAWRVRWQANRDPRHPDDASENYNDLVADLEGDACDLTAADHAALGRLGEITTDRYGHITVDVSAPNVSALRRAVKVTLPMALAACQRAAQPSPAPTGAMPAGSATRPEHRSVAEAMADHYSPDNPNACPHGITIRPGTSWCADCTTEQETPRDDR